MGIVDKIKDLLGIGSKAKKPSKFILKQEPDVIKQVSTAIRKENAQLKAKLAEVESRLEHYRNLHKDKRRDEQIVKAAIVSKKGIEKRKRKSRVAIKVMGKPVKVRTLSEKPFEFPYLYGFELEAVDDTPEVDFRFNILLSKDKEREKPNGRVYGTQNFRSLFKNPKNIINAIKSQTVDLSVRDDGTIKPIIPDGVSPEMVINSVKGKYMDAIAKLQDENERLRKRLNSEYNKRVDAEKREIDMRDNIDELNAAIEVAQKSTENRGAIIGAMIDKIGNMSMQNMRFLIPALEAPMNKAIQEKYSDTLERTIDKLDNRINEIIPEGQRKAVRNELLSDLREFKDIMPEAFPRHIGMKEGADKVAEDKS